MNIYMQHLFAYGALMCPEIMAEISGIHSSPMAASLRGYRRFCVKDHPYPAIALVPHGVVAGVLYHNITPAAWQRLDCFEGELYMRQQVEVTLPSGTPLATNAYVVRPEFRMYLIDCEWNFAEFLSTYKTDC